MGGAARHPASETWTPTRAELGSQHEHQPGPVVSGGEHLLVLPAVPTLLTIAVLHKQEIVAPERRRRKGRGRGRS